MVKKELVKLDLNTLHHLHSKWKKYKDKSFGNEISEHFAYVIKCMVFYNSELLDTTNYKPKK